MQPTASRTFWVTEAKAESSVTDSSLGLARRLSPTQTASKATDASARCAMSMRSLVLTAPMMTPRFASVRPKEDFMFLLRIRKQNGLSREGERWGLTIPSLQCLLVGNSFGDLPRSPKAIGVARGPA